NTNRSKHSLHIRMFVAQFLAELCLFTLKTRNLGLLLLDEGIRENGGERVERRWVLLACAQLVVERFLLDALGLGSGNGRVQVRQLLNNDVLAVFERDGVVLFPIAL